MAFLTRDGVRLYYEDHGSGPAVLLTHGYSATSQMWRGQIAAFKDRYRIIVWDMRGHGESDYPDDPALYSTAHTVADMGAVLDECGLDSAVIGGLSLGGYSALAFHLAHPDRCKALLLCDTGPGFKKDESRLAWNERANRRAEKLEGQGLAALGASAEVKQALHRDATGLARAARGMLAQVNADVIHSLPDIDMPALVVVGENDTPFLAATDYMAAKIPGAEKAVISDAGHAANIDNPADFNAAMGAFLDRFGG
ncbi:MAG: alpha/beta hydrolase [Alphaproteobacteria bacterium]|nr:alpha/beta hydrolase [Alphaproteobacteria bacterium]